MSHLTLERVSKIYPGGQRAVDSISFEVHDGCFCVLLGPSGCGKSTLLRMVAGIETISEGVVSLGGREVNSWHPKDRDMAMVFQNYALYPHLTVRDNIAFPLSMRRTPKAEIASRVGEVAAMLQLSDLLDRRPAQLSGGQRQRVALARAVVRRPSVFLFDEPLSNLDARMRLKTRTELKALHEQLRVTSLYVTHDQEEAMGLADQIVVINGGRLRQIAPPLDLYEKPADRFVAGFVGSPPMNFIDAVVRGGELDTGLGVRINVSDAPAGAAVLGVRPSCIRLVSPESPGAGRAVIESIEPLGDSMDVILRCGPHRLCARVPSSRDLSPQTATGFLLDLSRSHLFSPGPDGARLACTLGSPGPSARSIPNEHLQHALH